MNHAEAEGEALFGGAALEAHADAPVGVDDGGEADLVFVVGGFVDAVPAGTGLEFAGPVGMKAPEDVR